MSRIVRLLEETADRERDAAASVSMPGGAPTDGRSALAVARQLFRAQCDGRPAPLEHWGSAPQRASLRDAITFDPTVIVDLRPMPAERFGPFYGMEPSELLELARDGRVILNLYEYDSDDGPNGFVKHQQHEAVLLPFLEVGCRINSIRRLRLFDLLDCRSTFDDGLEEAQRLFSFPVNALPKEERALLLGSADAKGALTRLTWNWAYLRALPTSPSTRGWLDEIADSPPPSPHRLRQDLSVLAVLKAIFATPLTATFGGSANLSLNELLGALKSFGRIDLVLSPDDLRHLPNVRPGIVDMLYDLCFRGGASGLREPGDAGAGRPDEIEILPIVRRKARVFEDIATARASDDVTVLVGLLREYVALQNELDDKLGIAHQVRELPFVGTRDGDTVVLGIGAGAAAVVKPDVGIAESISEAASLGGRRGIVNLAEYRRNQQTKKDEE